MTTPTSESKELSELLSLHQELNKESDNLIVVTERLVGVTDAILVRLPDVPTLSPELVASLRLQADLYSQLGTSVGIMADIQKRLADTYRHILDVTHET